MNDTRAVKALSWGRGWCPPGPGLLPTPGGPGLFPRVQHSRFPPGAVPVFPLEQSLSRLSGESRDSPGGARLRGGATPVEALVPDHPQLAQGR